MKLTCPCHEVGQTIALRRLSTRRALVKLAKHDRPRKAMVCRTKENTHESPPIYPHRGRRPRCRRTGIRRAGRQHKAAARRPDRLSADPEMRPLPPAPPPAPE